VTQRTYDNEPFQVQAGGCLCYYLGQAYKILPPSMCSKNCELVLEEAYYDTFFVSQQCGFTLVNFTISKILTFLLC